MRGSGEFWGAHAPSPSPELFPTKIVSAGHRNQHARARALPRGNPPYDDCDLASGSAAEAINEANLPCRRQDHPLLAAHDRPQTHRAPLHDLDHALLFHRRRGGDHDAAGIAHAAGRPRHLRDLQQALHHPRRRHGLVLPHSVDPDRARKFSRAADDRRTRCRVPEAQSRELVSLHGGRGLRGFLHHHRRRRYRLDLLHALQQHLRERPCHRDGYGYFHRGIRLHRDRAEFHCHDSQNARPG